MTFLGPSFLSSVSNAVSRIAFTVAWEVLREVPVPDSEGGSTFTEAVTSNGLGSLQEVAAGSDQQLVADRLQVKRPAVLFVPVGADVTPEDRIRVSGTRLFKVMDVGLPGDAVVKQIVMDES